MLWATRRRALHFTAMLWDKNKGKVVHWVPPGNFGFIEASDDQSQ